MVGRVVVLLLLIVVLAAGGLVWFDYLNVIDAKTVLAPVYKYIPFIGGEGRTQPVVAADELLNLDAERLAVRLTALQARELEMDTRQGELDARYGEIEQMAQELEERQKALEELEKSFRAQVSDADNKDRNVDRNARNLNGMPPERAVAILAAMDDQDVIDILRKTEEIAQAEGTTSIVSYWLSLMEPARAAELQRKMAGRPPAL
ncbi:MAG TPA: flagellar protein FlbB [Treponema sp.]|nr:flagellar protein FlbB [Treponema sp.]